LSDSEIHSGETPMLVNSPDSPRPQGMRSTLTYIYTFAFAAAIVLVSLTGADQQVLLVEKRGHVFFYAFTIGSEFVILALAYVGIRFSGMRLGEIIGGKWKTVEDFLLDVGLGFGFSIFLLIVVASLAIALGLNRPGVVDPGRKVILAIAPRTTAELALFFSLSTTAGLVEEVVFRGYLQKQFGKLFGNVWIGMFLSAILFGLAHGYEGKQRMFIIVILGVLFGTMAILRKSLRTGMIAHALFDGIVGAVAMFALKSGMLK
jgi:membrane protease YdiL (CAAX protease family)